MNDDATDGSTAALREWMDWVLEQEQIILVEGEPLTPDEMQIAERIGVREPRRVRVQDVTRIEIPADLIVLLPEAVQGQVPDQPGGMCFGHGIRIPVGYKLMRLPLLTHELTHVRQIEELGLPGFSRQYFEDMHLYGYMEAPLEREAMENMMRYAPFDGIFG